MLDNVLNNLNIDDEECNTGDFIIKHTSFLIIGGISVDLGQRFEHIFVKFFKETLDTF